MPPSISLLRIRSRRLSSSMTSSSPSSWMSTKSALHPVHTTRLLPVPSATTGGASFFDLDGCYFSSRQGKNNSKLRYRCPLPTQFLSSPPTTTGQSSSRARNYYTHCGFVDTRRWASSIVAEDLDSDEYDDHDDDDNDNQIFEYKSDEEEEELIQEEEGPKNKNNTVTKKKTKLTKRQKRKQSLSGDEPLEINFLHFQKNNSDDNSEQQIAQDFEELAFVHDLSKFKWITALEKSLVLKLKQEQTEDEKHAETNDPAAFESRKAKKADRVRDYWKVALKAAGNTKKVPDDLKARFLTRMVAGNAAQAPNKDGIDDGSPTTAMIDGVQDNDVYDTEDALLLARGRELAVENPLLWRRYSAKERKLKVRRSKKLVEKKALRIAERMANADNNDAEQQQQQQQQLTPTEQAILAVVKDKSTSLDFYLRHVRVPALHRLHHEGKTAEQRHQEAVQLQHLLKERLPETSYQKMIALVQTYVNCFGDESSADNEGNLEDDDTNNGERLVTLQGSPLTPMPTGIEPEQQKQEQEQEQHQKKKQKQQQKQFRVLLSNLRKALPQGRIHWISRDVADFFYVTKPDEVDKKIEDIIGSDPILGYSEDNWNGVRDQYVHSFLNVQKLFLELEKEQDRQRKLREATAAKSSSTLFAEMDGLLDPDEDPSSEKSVLKTFDTVAALSRMDAQKNTTQRVKPRTYIPLEAMAIGDTWKSPSKSEILIESQTTQQLQRLDESSSTDNISNINRTNNIIGTINGTSSDVFDNDAFPLHPPVDRLVVVDNLPIDVTEFRLGEVYGRCGDIEAISIIHSRPDLDPGRRATDSSKKIRNASSSSQRQKWIRPRTPLYAMILYKEPTSAKKASCEPLRIFGMVLDQHAMRSHRASDMTTLYLEDVPCSTHTVSSMELELGRLLEGSDLYVCLDDSGQHLSLRTKASGFEKQHYTTQLLSYTIKFPSFEAAYWSYWKISRELPLLLGTTTTTDDNPPSPDNLGGAALHWMDTPMDSHLYWTRKLNF